MRSNPGHEKTLAAEGNFSFFQLSPQTSTKPHGSAAAAAAANLHEDRAAAAVSTCRAIDSWALALFALAGIVCSVIYSLIYGFSG